MQIKDKLTGILRQVEDFFIPPLCVVCDGPLSDNRNDGGGNWLCPSCVAALIKNHEGREPCPRCARNRRLRECACAFAWDFPFESACCVYDYDDTLSVIAKHFKYHGKSRLAYRMGILGAPLIPANFFDAVGAVIPVPLHRSKLRARGYNQAEHFARGVLAGRGMDAALLRTDLLKRVKKTGTQTRLDREERQKNLAGAFAVNDRKASELAGMRVALADDIFTTGATAAECAAALLGAGCAGVTVLTLGRD